MGPAHLDEDDRKAEQGEPSGLPEGLLLSLLAHELRTPIQSISLSADVSLMRLRGAADGLPTAWMVERLEQIQRAARSMRNIVETVLGAAQLEAGRAQRARAGAHP